MIEFTKLNGNKILINPFQIESVELIPESKIVMMNGKYYIIREDKDTIIEMITQYRKEVGGAPIGETL